MKKFKAFKQGLPDLIIKNVKDTNEAGNVASAWYKDNGYGYVDPFTIDLQEVTKIADSPIPKEKIEDEEITSTELEDFNKAWDETMEQLIFAI